MGQNAYLSIKNPKAFRALKHAMDPSRKLLASLTQVCFATLATFGLRSWGPPLTKSWNCTWYPTFVNCIPYYPMSYVSGGGREVSTVTVLTLQHVIWELQLTTASNLIASAIVLGLGDFHQPLVFPSKTQVLQVRFQDFVKGGTPISEAKSFQCSKVESHKRSEQSVVGSRPCLRALEAFQFLMLKCVFSHILETL